MIAPVLVEPFLSLTGQSKQANGTMTELAVNTTTQSINLTDTRQEIIVKEVIGDSRIAIPYCVATGILILAGVLLLVLYFQLPYLAPSNEEREKKRSQQSLELSERTKYYRSIVILLGCCLFLVYSGIEFNSFTFFVKFAVSIDLHLSKSKGAMMASLLSAFYALGRLTSIYVATKMKTKTMLAIHLFLVGTGNLMLLSFANSSETMIWLSIMIMGYGYSSICPSLYAFLEDRISVTSTICGWFMFFSTVSSVVNAVAIGQLMDLYPLAFVYTNLISLIFCYAVFALFYATDRYFKKCRKQDTGTDSTAITKL